MDSSRTRVVRLLAWIAFATGFLLLGAHMSVQSLLLELRLTYVVYGIAVVGLAAAAGAIVTRRAEGRRSLSVAGIGALLANVVLVALTYVSTTVVVALPAVPFGYSRGDVLPEFEVEPRAEDGRAVRLADLRGRPVVLVFHRGGWCPFCQAQLAGLNTHFAALAEDAEVLAISVDVPAAVRAWARASNLGFSLLHDEGAVVARQYGLTYHSDAHDNVPVPATIVLDADGRIAWFHVAEDVRDRPDPREIMTALESLP